MTRTQRRNLLIAIIALAVAVLIGVGTALAQDAPSIAAPAQPPGTQARAVSQETLDQVSDRIDDIATFTTLVVALGGGFVAALSLIAGFSFWKTLKDSKTLLESRFQVFEQSRLKPVVEAASAQVRSTRVLGALALVEAGTVLFDGMFGLFERLAAELASRGAARSERQAVDRIRAEYQLLTRVLSYQLALLTYDPTQVQATCQMFATMCRELAPDLKTTLSSVKPRVVNLLSEMLGEAELASARIDIQRLLDELNRM